MTDQITIRPLDENLVKTLTRSSNESQLCASLYMPIEQTGKEVRQNAIRLKNHLHRLVERVQAIATDEQTKAWQTSALASDNDTFDNDTWHELRHFPGLQVVCHENQPPFVVGLNHKPEHGGVYVGPFVYVREILRSYLSQEDALVLELSQNQANLFAYRDDDLHALHVEGLPLSLEAVAGRQTEPTTLQHHATGRSTVFHGQAINKDDTDHELVQYTRAVAECVERYVKEQGGKKLFVAATEPLASMFPTYYKRPIDSVLAVQVSEPSELIRKIKEQLAVQRRADLDRWFDRWGESSNRTLGVEDTYQAAKEGRLEGLVVQDNEPYWHVLAENYVFDDDETAACRINPVGAVDLVDLTLHEAWNTGAKIHLFDAHDVSVMSDELIALCRDQAVFGIARY